MKLIKPVLIAVPAAIVLAVAIACRTPAQSNPISNSSRNSVAMIKSGIIEPVSDSRVAPEKERPTGGLYVQTSDRKQQAFTLTNTDVKGQISGNISRIEVTQTFQNPYDKPLEAIYVFPLPDQAAVDDMEIQIGDRIIKGDIKKRDEAKAIYERARQEGRTAGLLEQERDNIFTQSLANIKPGEQIKVTIRYTESLKFEEGDYEFVFPMVVGPRYIPGNAIDQQGCLVVTEGAFQYRPNIVTRVRHQQAVRRRDACELVDDVVHTLARDCLGLGDRLTEFLHLLGRQVFENLGRLLLAQ